MDRVGFAGKPLGGGVGRAESKVEFDTTAVCDPTALLAHRINFTPILTKRAAGFATDRSRMILQEIYSALRRTEVSIPYYRMENIL